MDIIMLLSMIMEQKEKNHTIEKVFIVAAVMGVTLATVLKGADWGKDVANHLIKGNDSEKIKKTVDFFGSVVGAGIAAGASHVAINSLSYRDKIFQEKSENQLLVSRK